MSRSSSIRRPDVIRNDRFPLLEVSELSVCLRSCNLTAPEEDLYRPTPIFVQNLFIQILDTFLSLPSSVLKSRQRRLLEEEEETPGEFEDSLDIVTLQMVLYKFFVDCGVDDFLIMDLIKPEPIRLKRLLSAVVNFARFREEHLYDNEQIIHDNNVKFEKHSEMSAENTRLKENISRLINDNDKIKSNLDELNKHNERVESELRSLKKIQESLTAEHMNYKTEKSRLIQALEDHNYLLLESKKDLEKMKNYIIESPEIISKIISDMQESLKDDQQTLNELELRSRKLAITIESVGIIQQDLKNCVKLVDELQVESNKENMNNNKLNQQKEFYEDRSLKLNELERKIQLLLRQIKNMEDKIERTSEQKEARRGEYEKKMKQLSDTYANALAEQGVTDKELQKKKMYIQSVQKNMQDIEIAFKKEYDETTLELQRLNTHVKFYLNQLEEKLQL
ncbi:NUF2 [Cyberlindnera jadinii]|uniref:NUF2 protein n=1 Tax=Cyberlindnera jadinii (strain ATCC 18201 / CBS 1600 / BCRC 20928 / JCM 3617 / NBRC 0987 / NRRL Y-1542) TaxID=983966 RepID=A0A0H5C8W7_CYBJN|nr:NUF2 [Cyberlindnera jadinii]